jgi:hypothetical protein
LLRPVLLAAIPCASFAVAGCVDNYHPEYHPVTVSEVSQNLSYPVAVHNGISAAERGPVYVVPGTAPVLVQPLQPLTPMQAVPPPPMPPAEWFRGY